MKVSKLGILVVVAAMALMLGAFRPGFEPQSAEATIVTAYAVPSSIPGTVPAIAPASAPGNIAVVGIYCGAGGCPIDTNTLTDDITFTLTRVYPTGDPAATFAANGGTTLVCDERTAAWVPGDADCDLDITVGGGNVAVQVNGGGQNEVVNVEACDQTGSCQNTRIIFVETILAVSPLHAAASFEPHLISYACPVRGPVTVTTAVDAGDTDLLADLENTVNTVIPAFVAGGVLPPGTSMILPEDFDPEWACGSLANTPQNRVSFETDAGILSVEAFVNGVTISGACDAGDSVDVVDYPTVAGVPPASNQCDLDAFRGPVVTYGLEGTGDVGVATLTAQQLGGGGPLRTINVTFIGAAAMSLFIDAPATVGTSGADFTATVVDQNGAPVANETVECTVAPTGGALVVLPQTGTTDANGDVTMTLVPTGASVIAGEELTLTCALDSNPDVSASTTINLSMEPELEVVDLVAGCNPVSSTWADGTDVADVADGVAPAEALDAIWAFDTASGAWQGYSPTAPAGVSDLATVDRLQAIFVCVNADATISRPVI